MKSRARIVLILLFVILYLVTARQMTVKAGKGKGAFVRQSKHSDMLDRREVIYNASAELYPNPPMMLLIQKPFRAMGPIWGSLCWMTFKYVLILFIFWVVITVARNNGPPWPDWLLVILFCLSIPVFHLDLTHANVNLLTGGLIGASLLCSFKERDSLAGMAIGFATALRMTPGLFILYFIYKRRWSSVVGAGVGIFLFIWIIPGIVLGFDYNNLLVQKWLKQMTYPFLMGISPDNSSHINQSVEGLLRRLLTDSVAIEADIERGYDEVRINIVSMDYKTVSVMVKIGYLAVIGCLARFCRTPRKDHKHFGNLGEFALVFLATLLISPWSWKHHYVMLILAHGFIIYYLLSTKPSGWRKWVPLSALIASSIPILLSGEVVLGQYWSDIAEAYGAYVIGTLFLFAGCAAILEAMRLDSLPNSLGTEQDLTSDI